MAFDKNPSRALVSLATLKVLDATVKDRLLQLLTNNQGGRALLAPKGRAVHHRG